MASTPDLGVDQHLAEHELAPLKDPEDSVLAPLPTPGAGRTAERFVGLWTIAARSPSLGRVAEAHHDAVAILREAGRSADEEGLLAVWAAGGGPEPLQLRRQGRHWRLHGRKAWCSAATTATRALVTAQLDGSEALVLVDLTHDGVQPEASTWQSPALVAVDTRNVTFDLAVTADDIIATDDWYTRRAGFWHGAIGVAACWAGCAAGIVDRLLPTWRDDPHAIAHLGAIDAKLWNLGAVLHAAGDEIDSSEFKDTAAIRQRRAFRVRQLTDAGVGEIIDRLTRALGPGPLAHVPHLHRHLAEVDLYRRQSAAERDLEVLGRFSSKPFAPTPDLLEPHSPSPSRPSAG